MRTVKRHGVRRPARRYFGNPANPSDGLTTMQMLAFGVFALVMLIAYNANRPHCSDLQHVNAWDKATVEAYATCKQ